MTDVVSRTTTNQDRAREIMGENFFDIKEAIEHFEVNPSKQQIAALAEVPFSEEVLESCKDTHMLVATPVPMSILDVREANSKLFYKSAGGWYDGQMFAKRKGIAGWWLVRMTPVEDSMSKTWEQQRKLLGRNDETASARVMVYAIIAHERKTGKRLFKEVWVRTSCVINQYHVRVGYFDSDGLNVDTWWDGGHEPSLGLSSAWKPCILNS